MHWRVQRSFSIYLA
jgi:hypothetical protein